MNRREAITTAAAALAPTALAGCVGGDTVDPADYEVTRHGITGEGWHDGHYHPFTDVQYHGDTDKTLDYQHRIYTSDGSLVEESSTEAKHFYAGERVRLTSLESQKFPPDDPHIELVIRNPENGDEATINSP